MLGRQGGAAARAWPRRGSESRAASCRRHPFWSLDRGQWVPAGELRAGEVLRAANGEAVVIALFALSGTATVYNVEVHQEHAFCIADSALLVHNACVFPRYAAKFEQKEWITQIADDMVEHGQLRRVAVDYIKQELGSAGLPTKVYRELEACAERYVNVVLEWAP